jgi:hypothetical protein
VPHANNGIFFSIFRAVVVPLTARPVSVLTLTRLIV